MKVLIVDNEDSFTFNLKHYVNKFVSDVRVLRSDNICIHRLAEFDKIILSPGPGLPSDHPVLNKIILHYHKDKSILGVCLGQQAIAEFFNAELQNLDIVKHGVSSTISHFDNCKLFRNISREFKVGHYHSWVVSRNNFPHELNITSENEDGIITSINHIEFDLVGVQFHPESILTENGLELIKNWLFS